MNRDDLKNILVCKRVDESLYSLNGPATDSESYSIVEDGGTWKVVYKERGDFSVIGVRLSEDEACDLVYQLFKDAFDWAD